MTKTSILDVDLFVIGAGSGGVRAARIAAGHGAAVAIAESDRVGGTCVIRGCVPKKLLVVASRFAETFDAASGFGWSHAGRHFDWKTLIGNTQGEVARLESLYRGNLEASGVVLCQEHACLVDAHTIRLRSGRLIRARHILVATGARAVRPEFPGAEHLLSSDDLFELPALPRSFCVMGGGYIAVEVAGLLAGLGVSTTLVHRGSQLLRGFDEDLQRSLHQALVERGIRVELNAVVSRVDAAGEGFQIRLADGRSLAADRVLAATGRRPNTDGLGLEAAGVSLDGAGAIPVDQDSRTRIPGIFAVGDVTNRVNLTPVALREGQAVAELLFGSRTAPVDHRNVPTAVFSTPEIGTVGPSEQQARELYPRLQVYRSSFVPLASALSRRKDRMLIKLLVDGDSGRVVAAHLLGTDAAELIQLMAVAIRGGLTKSDFDATVAVHPTVAEELVTLRMAVPAAPSMAAAATVD
ncbi:glutathione-disulfide reductase [Variovorax sp. WS11]|uniref:glutathione-disulfide reductase n=1 Tax=Variovorax sp. WS11 TaxID=1105204 RepID=UPI000D0D51ED|nr:glutathione-disulfide reductase [Variovorax sp. WS11]NDZ14805.1 glutathione-disulfide reductase [Variovorax sp. WS11]PSL85674.1 glutathione-disulfide reductase [Variovorax sp. WS11]